MKYKLINGQLLLRDNGNYTVEQQDLYVKDGKIVAIGALKDDADFTVVDAKDRLIMPGLINSHGHLYMTTFRGIADDVDFNEWLFERIMPTENKMTPDEAYNSCMLGCMEMIQSGTTSFLDMHMFAGQSARAATETGLRAFIGRCIVGNDLRTDAKARFDELLAEQEAFESDRIRFMVMPHAIYTCSEQLLRQLDEEAKSRKMLKHIHMSESDTEIENCLKERGKTPMAYLRDIGFMDEMTSMAHCVKLTDEDIAIIAKSGATVVTNPASNCKLGNGFARIRELKEAGVNVALGTDSTASNNTLNMFREMGVLTLIHKGIHKDSTVLPATYVLDTATANAARAFGMTGRLGEIKVGAYADLVFVDLNAPSLFPNNNIVGSLCYSANGSEVDSVMIDGKFVYKNREFLTIDREQVLYNIKKDR